MNITRGIMKSRPLNSPCPSGSTATGDYHTHGDYYLSNGARTTKDKDVFDSDHFSTLDITGLRRIAEESTNHDYTGYLGIPGNVFLKFQPSKGAGEEVLK